MVFHLLECLMLLFCFFFFWIFGHLAFLSDIACIMFVKITKMEKKKKILSTAMLPRQAQTIKKLWEFATQNSSTFSIVGNKLKHQCGSYSTGQTCRELPRKCSVCGEVHIGNPPHKIRTCNVMGSAASKEHSWKRGAVEHILPLVESFHLYDRLGRAVSHNERLQVDRIPAILELCVQAGINFSEYPTRRRVFPAYSISGRIIDFERRFPKEDAPGKDINSCGFWQKRNKTSGDSKFVDLQPGDLQGIAVRGMEAWKRMHSGASRLMQKYAVQTCGYCLEVQVGPKGHRVRNCQAYKQQMRDGQHAWQEATIDEVIPPVYVWHIQNHQSGKPLVNELKRYYGMLPAVVELFAQAGASVPDDYAGMMREDVAVPELDEEMLVV
ncbi:Uncharacterized protein TCM_007306 isoform 3 [Theobroma cacao]|uniref:Uncharacterized protein isoform 3 n=1 Tax=Theobroma cacao TaxID=3641 RepID=A0A061E8J6_THECC|nr:Uncharacterized protein TCM_007306 isoform 3 [Theobroma cacao]EOX98593.1 Uncharacterized protein TCM_007306 isoform 3 [Theobroma cacao]